MIEGSARYVIEDTGETQILSKDFPGVVFPEQGHHVEPIGNMRMRVEFYDHLPSRAEQTG